MSAEHSKPQIHSEPIISPEILRQEVAGLITPKDPETEAKIITGYRDLFSSVLSSCQIPLSTPEQVQQVKVLMTDIFLASTTQAPTKIVAKKRATYEHWDRDVLNPLEAVVLIRRFGLNDSDRKTLQQVSASLGYKTLERSRQIEARGLRKLRHHIRKIQTLITF